MSILEMIGDCLLCNKRSACKGYYYCNTCRSKRAQWKKKGIDLRKAEEVIKNHVGLCEICGTLYSGKHDWHLDHDHVTGKVRGLLCLKCNMGLGMFKDRPSLLRLAAIYLETHL